MMRHWEKRSSLSRIRAGPMLSESVPVQPQTTAMPPRLHGRLLSISRSPRPQDGHVFSNPIRPNGGHMRTITCGAKLVLLLAHPTLTAACMLVSRQHIVAVQGVPESTNVGNGRMLRIRRLV